MAHSMLSVPMNLGLLSPLEVVQAAVTAYESGAARLASVEGFVRQIIGWRDYVWQLYWHFLNQILTELNPQLNIYHDVVAEKLIQLPELNVSFFQSNRLLYDQVIVLLLPV